jgi:hypothetical protein
MVHVYNILFDGVDAKCTDPKALNLSYEPLSDGYNAFITHKVEVESNKAFLKKKSFYFVFCLFPLLIGLIAFFMIPYLFVSGKFFYGFLTLFFCPLLCMAGAGLLMDNRTIFFDQKSGKYYRKALYVHRIGMRENLEGNISDIIALQLIEKYVSSESGGYNKSYELNLVVNKDIRVNVIDHSNYAEEIGANKIALGHHRDDILETLFLNMFYGGKLKSMPPKLVSDDGKHTVIRPLAYAREKDIEEYSEIKGFPIIPCNLCGSQENLQRQVIKEMLQAWDKQYPGRIETMFRSLQNVVPSHLADTELFDFKGLKTGFAHGIHPDMKSGSVGNTDDSERINLLEL